jgi:hypothetical protein
VSLNVKQLQSVGRRNRVWKQTTLTPAQNEAVKSVMRKKRWSFQTCSVEALKNLCTANGVLFPDVDDEVE